MKEIRNNFYGKYQGKEYRLANKTTDHVFLMTNDDNELNNGFTKVDNTNNLYEKYVSTRDIEDVYWIRTFVAYKGHKFRVDREENNLICFGTDDEILAKELDFECLDRGFCLKWVDKSELAIFEEKELRPNFFKN